MLKIIKSIFANKYISKLLVVNLFISVLAALLGSLFISHIDFDKSVKINNISKTEASIDNSLSWTKLTAVKDDVEHVEKYKELQNELSMGSLKLDYFLKIKNGDSIDDTGLILTQDTPDLKLRLNFFTNKVKSFEIAGATYFFDKNSEEYSSCQQGDTTSIETNFVLLPSVYDIVITNSRGEINHYKVNLCYEYTPNDNGFDYELWSHSRNSFIHTNKDGVVIDSPQKERVNAIIFKKRFTSGIKASIVFMPMSDNFLFSINLSDKVSLVLGEDGRKRIKLRIAKKNKRKMQNISYKPQPLFTKIEKNHDFSIGIERVGNNLIVTDAGNIVLNYNYDLPSADKEIFRSLAICNWRNGGKILIKNIKIEGVK